VSEWDWLPIAGAHLNKHATGFMADDVVKVFPGAVTKEDAYLTVRDASGKAQMVPAPPTPPWQDPDGGPGSPRTETRLIEKTQEFKDLQYVCLADALPTLWGAVQKLIQEVEALKQK